MKLSDESILSIGNYFSNKPVIKAYLFGSQASGKADNESDVDLLVELDYSEGIGLMFIQMQLDLEELLDKKVDLVSANGMSKYIQPIIDKEKKMIYARRN